MSVLDIEGLSVRLRRGPHLLRGVTLSVAAGEVLGLVGESGAGKSMIGRAVLGILPQAVAVTAGRMRLGGVDLGGLTPRARRRLIGAGTALIPQDPMTALNPARRIGPQITGPLVDVLGWDRRRAATRAAELLAEVQVPDPDRVLRACPHELSGGMRQRVLIAAAFATEPRLIIADEPTTALDVLAQARILGLIRELQGRHGTAMLFITHDLAVVSRICDRVAVLCGGLVLEVAETATLLAAPVHPYAAALIAASPRQDAPEAPLVPVAEAVLAGVRAEIAAWEAAHA